MNGNRLTRQALTRAACLTPFDPPIESPLGNVIAPSHLIDIDWADVPAMVQAETALTLAKLAPNFEVSVGHIFNTETVGIARVSLTAIEIAWDVPTAHPEALARTFARAVSANLQSRTFTAGSPPPATAAPPIYMLVGLHPRFKLVIYPKLAAGPGGLGLTRFEFRFRKRQIKANLGTTVLPRDRDGIARAIAKLAASAWPTLVVLDLDRAAPRRPLSTDHLLRAIGGVRNQKAVAHVLDQLAADGKVRLTRENRRIVQRLEQEAIVCRLLFSRPAWRKLVSGVDLSTWRQLPPQPRASDPLLILGGLQ